MRTTVGKLIVNDALPEWLQDYTSTLSADKTEEILQALAEKSPDKYREISHKLTDIGRNASFEEAATLSMSDMEPPIDRKELFDHARKQTHKILSNKSLSKQEKQTLIGGVYSTVQKAISDATYDAGIATQNPFALQVLSKARGNKAQLAALQATHGSYSDPQGNIIPVFIQRSFAEGQLPHEYWAGSFGARTGVVGTKFATREAGDLGKQFNQASMRTVVTGDDCGTLSGVPVSKDDPDNIGSELAHAVGKYPAGTVITKEVLKDLDKVKQDEIVVRSPMACGLAEGVCKHCVGLREDGKYPKQGEHVGITASSALAERIAQGSLNTKHGGGATKDGKKQDLAGFPIINQLFQSPKQFAHAASVATVDGVVERIEDAPQGGKNIVIDGTKHYMLPENDLEVEVGDKVEAGDQLSDGLLNVRDVIEHKGVGEARRYMAERATKAFRDSGYAVHRRNMELLVRGVINHAEIEDDNVGAFLPGDVTDYNSVAATYKPRGDSKILDTNAAIGQYLEQPVLHHTIGTRVTDKVAKQLKKHGYKDVHVNQAPPPFKPRVFGLRAVPQQESDWMAQLGSSHLTKNLLKNVHRGAESNLEGLHPVPAMAKSVDLGKKPTGSSPRL